MRHAGPRLWLSWIALPAIAVTLAGCRGSTHDSHGRPGVEMTFRVDAAPRGKLGSGDIVTVANVIRARLAALGRKGTVAPDAEAHELVLRVDGAPLRAKERSRLLAHAFVSFYDLETAAAGPSAADQNGNVHATTNLFDLLAAQQATVTTGRASAWYLFEKQKAPAGGPAPTRANLLSRYGGIVPEGFKVFGVPKNTVVTTCGKDEAACPGVATPTRTYYYLFKHGSDPNDRHGPYPSLTSTDLKLPSTQAHTGPDGLAVLVAFTSKGGKRFQEITREEYRRGRVVRNPQHFAIVLDNRIVSFPQIDYTDSSLADGIDAVNGARITGLKDRPDAKSLALALRSGGLPFQFVLLSERVVR